MANQASLRTRCYGEVVGKMSEESPSVDEFEPKGYRLHNV